MASPQLRWDGVRVPAPSGASKVPYRITAFFWIIKILTTAMGEALADFLALHYSPVLAGVVGTTVFAVALVLQFRARRYRVWIYWFAVAMVAVWGTLAADGLHIKLGVPYALSSTFFAVCLAVVFVAWYATERTLSIHSITTPRRELFYWATVLATFALGTAVGDMTATTLHLGFLTSGLMFTGLICLPALAYWKLGLNSVLAFWIAYVLTRPLGASYADWLGVPHRYGGVGLGRGLVALILSVVIVGFVAYLAVTRKDVEPGETRRASRAPAARHRR
ncbi:MAG: COG4705 family protein [Streptosporangiaceae bacterium]